MPKAQAKETLPVPSLACNASFNPEPGHPLAGRDGDYPLSPSGAVPSPLREGRMRAGGLSWFCTRIFLLIAPPHECVALAQFLDGWYKSLIAKALRVANLPSAPPPVRWVGAIGRTTAGTLRQSSVKVFSLVSPRLRGEGQGRGLYGSADFFLRVSNLDILPCFWPFSDSRSPQEPLRIGSGWPQDRLRTGSGPAQESLPR